MAANKFASNAAELFLVSFQHVVARMLFFTLPKLTCDYCCLGFGCNKPQPTLTACTRGGPQRYAYHRINHCHSRAPLHTGVHTFGPALLHCLHRLASLDCLLLAPTPPLALVRSFVRMRLAENHAPCRKRCRCCCVRACVGVCVFEDSATAPPLRTVQQRTNSATQNTNTKPTSQSIQANIASHKVPDGQSERTNERTIADC